MFEESFKEKNHQFGNLQLLKSAVTLDGGVTSTKFVLDWIKSQNERVEVNVRKSTFSKLSDWGYDSDSGNIKHNSGRFFSIDGIRIQTNWGNLHTWDQPIINQPEVGYLGFITKEFNGILHFLVQAKIEPGNVNFVQLSPTLQATRSNYTQVHKGKKPKYLEYFQKAKPYQILLDQLQSEQGARFLRKRNRNIIIKIEEEVEIFDNFIWLTLGQIKHLMAFDNIVNMDTRTVVSGITYGSFSENIVDVFNFLTSGFFNNTKDKLLSSLLVNGNGIHNIDEILSFITHYKSTYDLKVNQIDLKKIDQWVYSEEKVHHAENKYFNVIPVEVEIGNREVVKWSQPMVEPAQDGLCAFVAKEINGILHFAVQAKLECGNLDIIELAPTVQCLTGNYRSTKEGKLPFLDYVLNIDKNQVLFDTLQSEEGGRFYKEQNRNMVVIAGDEIPVELPDKYIWMTLSQISMFLKINNFLNIQARSLIAAIPFV